MTQTKPGLTIINAEIIDASSNNESSPDERDINKLSSDPRKINLFKTPRAQKASEVRNLEEEKEIKKGMK